MLTTLHQPIVMTGARLHSHDWTRTTTMNLFYHWTFVCDRDFTGQHSFDKPNCPQTVLCLESFRKQTLLKVSSASQTALLIYSTPSARMLLSAPKAHQEVIRFLCGLQPDCSWLPVGWWEVVDVLKISMVYEHYFRNTEETVTAQRREKSNALGKADETSIDEDNGTLEMAGIRWWNWKVCKKFIKINLIKQTGVNWLERKVKEKKGWKRLQEKLR